MTHGNNVYAVHIIRVWCMYELCKEHVRKAKDKNGLSDDKEHWDLSNNNEEKS